MRQGFDLIRDGRERAVGVELVQVKAGQSQLINLHGIWGAKVDFGGVQILVSNDRQGERKRGKDNSLCKSTALGVCEYDSTSTNNSIQA